MNDFEGLLATNYGFKPQGKAAPMAAPKGTSNINATTSPNFDLGSRGSFRSAKTSNSLSGSLADDHDSLHRSMSAHENREFGGLDDLLGGSAKFSRKSESRGGDSDVNFDSLFHGAGNSGQPAASSSPVYDKPVYDDDIFDGIPGLRSSSKVQYDDVFSSMSSPPKADSAFDDLLGGFGKSEGVSKSTGGKGTQSKDKEIPAFDDLIPGFRSRSPPGDRSTSGASWSSEPTSVKNANNKAFDDMDPFASLGKSVPAFSSEGSNRDMARSPPRVDRNAAGPQNSNSKETVEKPSGRTSGQPLKKDVSAKNDRQDDQPVFDIPTVSSNSHKFMPQSTSPPASKAENVMGDTSRFEDNVEPDEIWLTVSEIPLFTQPTVAPPPSRPPPPIPQQVPKEGMGLSGSRSSKMNANDFSSFPNSTHHFQIPKPASASMGDQVSSIDELEEFAMGRNQSNADEQVNGLSSEELEMNSAAAAMKEAMDRAEAKFKHAKEVRERESTRTSRSKEAVYWDREEKGMRNERVEDEESLDHERFQREREREREREEKEKEKRRVEKERERTRELEKEREEREKEQRRLEKERERARELEMERIKVRQAVERATREARERAATEARLKAERAAVEKANAEARERAERTAVQRAQAEARERAAAEARERAERAAAEAREKAEKAAAEAKEREARERASVARAEAEARSRAERAAVERAAAEARERAAVDARERAAAAARASQQKAENDLESFFSMGRASSAPRPRANPMDNFFDAQPPSRPASETTKPSSATSSNLRKASSATNIVDDLSAIFGGPPSSGEFQEVDGESEERRRARLERHQRVQSRAAKALAEKNERDLQMQREQAERHRISETLDSEIKRWAAGKEGNLRALLSTLQYVLWPECGWQPVSLTEMVIPNAVKKAYRKATLCIHPDKVQQKGATLQQKYVAEKVFDILKEAWNKFNSEELF
ncbi:Auxilin-related protein 2, partial [Cucurbita argyrosperma subsp. sororia]